MPLFENVERNRDSENTGIHLTLCFSFDFFITDLYVLPRRLRLPEWETADFARREAPNLPRPQRTERAASARRVERVYRKPNFQASKLPNFQLPLHRRHALADVPGGRSSRRFRRYRRCRSARKRAIDEAGDSKPSFSALNFHFVLFAGLCALAVEGLALRTCTVSLCGPSCSL